MSFRLKDLLEATSGRLVGAADDIELKRLVIDSRQAGDGALFVALAGEATDGHLFLGEAVAAGASAVLAQRATDVAVPQVLVPDTREALVDFTRHQLRAHRCRVVGVTGSAGKTSTKEMIAAVAARRYQVLKTEGNLNTYTGLPMSVALLEPGHQLFVAEFAMSAPGEIAQLARMAPPDVAVVLNVGLAHVGMPDLGSIDAIAAAKRELVEALPESGVAVLNTDDPRVAAMAEASRGGVLFFGLQAGGDNPAGRPADVRAVDVRLDGLAGSRFQLVLPHDHRDVRLRVPGVHAISNALAAAAAGVALEVPAEGIAAALEACAPVSGRMVVRQGRRGSTIIDDTYNASPASVEAALSVLMGERDRPHLAVLGEMLELGPEAEAAHRRIGRAAAAVDMLVAVGEHAAAIAAGAREGGLQPTKLITGVAVADVPQVLEPHLDGAVVLVKASRGMALEQVVEALVEPR